MKGGQTVEKLVSPELYVAVPTIQAISYSMNSKELRSLYANLLAKAMHKDHASKVHPSYVEIIKQLSPQDALIFSEIASKEFRPFMKVFMQFYNTRSMKLFLKNATWIQRPIADVDLSIDNLARLGLLNLDTEYFYEQEEYSSVRNNPYYIQALKDAESVLDTQIFKNFKHEFGAILLPTLGGNFYRICVLDKLE